MRAIPFRFFAKLFLLMVSFVLGILSLTSNVTMEEFAYAAGSIMAAMLGTSIKSHRKHLAHKQQKHPNSAEQKLSKSSEPPLSAPLERVGL